MTTSVPLVLPQKKVAIAIDERKIGKRGHQIVGMLTILAQFEDLFMECFVKTRSKAERAMFETLLDMVGEYKRAMETDLAKISKRVGALEILNDAAPPEELPN